VEPVLLHVTALTVNPVGTTIAPHIKYAIRAAVPVFLHAAVPPVQPAIQIIVPQINIAMSIMGHVKVIAHATHPALLTTVLKVSSVIRAIASLAMGNECMWR
jgi:hypothetical protein